MTTALALVGIVLLLGIIYYNQLVRRKNEVDNASGSIDAMLKLRYDLIPNLVDTVKRYMIHETEVLEKLTAMRTLALNNHSSEAEKQLVHAEAADALKQIMIAVENYPELKASTNFIQLQQSWMDVEDRISSSRRFYNHAITEYNIVIKSFPQAILASILGYKAMEVFKVNPEEAKNLSSKTLFDN